MPKEECCDPMVFHLVTNSILDVTCVLMLRPSTLPHKVCSKLMKFSKAVIVGEVRYPNSLNI
jgi:hypothetical protein